jgi:guanylate kinase
VIVVLAGPSGVGKGSIVRGLLERDPNRNPKLWFSVSMNTRAKRPGEQDGVDYWFVDRAEFERIRDEGGFLEWFQVYDDLKGTPKAPIDEHLAAGDDVLLELDVQGARAVQAAYPDAVLVFVKPPSREEQRERLFARDPGADPGVLERRLDQAEAEEREATDFDAVVVNDVLSRAVDEVAAILQARRDRQ